LKSALIGYTGFVGSNINHSHEFDDKYNSANIGEIEGQTYDLVVSAANRAEMWRINKEPEKDLAEINKFIDHIKKVNINKLVLISTVGVYDKPVGVDEHTSIDPDNLTPYGANRFYLEEFCRKHFDTVIIRLPGLFGEGLKKNIIFDLLNDNNLDNVHKDGQYQYYDLSNLWQDVEAILKSGEIIVNLVTPPVSTEEVARQCFGIEYTNAPADIKPAAWDVRTTKAAIFGSEGDYIMSKDEELNKISHFVSQNKGSAN
jgi:nucleoside-diphosphate-sugar epimerase